jgi:hypothetical protein
VVGCLLASLGSGAGQTPLCNGLHPGNPELVSGAASCVYNEVGGAGRTLIDLSDTSIIRWDHLGLGKSESVLTFTWSGNAGAHAAVINRVERGNAGRNGSLHSVAGRMEFPGGDLVITNPASAVTVSGTVAAGSVLFATHQLDPVMEELLLDGQAVDFRGSVHPLNVIDGEVVATHGDVVLAGRQVFSSAMENPGEEAAEISAPAGSVRIFGGESFRLLPAGEERLRALPGSAAGSVNNSKSVRAGHNVEVSASHAIDNSGLMEANGGRGRIMLRVDDGMGHINNDGVMLGFVTSSLPITNSGRIVPDEGDAPSGLSTGISRFPVLHRPGEKPTKRRVVVYENAPTTGSASTQRQRDQEAGGTQRKARLASNGGSRSGKNALLARGRSFFGLRGRTSGKKTR